MLKIHLLEQLANYGEPDEKEEQKKPTGTRISKRILLKRQKSAPEPILRQTREEEEAEKLKTAAQDLFDLVIRAQSSRLDDQRCEPPPGLPLSPRGDRSSKTESIFDPDKLPSSPTILPSPRELLETALRDSSDCPPPTLVLPVKGGYREEKPGGRPWSKCDLELDEGSTAFRAHFLGKEHCNLTSDASNGPAMLSLRAEEDDTGKPVTRAVLRLLSGTTHRLLTSNETALAQSPAQVAKLLSSEISGTELFTPVVCPRAAELIAAYDEHALASTFKFGVVEQKFGQVTEEEIFSNLSPSPALVDFLEIIGKRVRLTEHKGYRGGLDTQNGQTGEEAVYEVFREREIMFHVAPMLPFTENDSQQLQRKRHIGNDIAMVVFQEKETPFTPDMIASHFLHVFLVVQLVRDTGAETQRYRVWVTARSDVPQFGPSLPVDREIPAGPELREWVLTKLINAETAACKASKFAALESRTRCALLNALSEDLKARTRKFLGGPFSSSPEAQLRLRNVSTASPGLQDRFLNSVRRAIRVRSHSVADFISSSGKAKDGAPISLPLERTNTAPNSPLSLGASHVPWSGGMHNNGPASVPDLTRHVSLGGSESDASSLESSTGVMPGAACHGDNNDTGFESLTSSVDVGAEACPGSPVSCTCHDRVTDDTAKLEASFSDDSRLQVAALQQEVARLKCDKLDLLRHNLVCQREMHALREEALQLQSEYQVAARELLRMRDILRNCANEETASQF